MKSACLSVILLLISAVVTNAAPKAVADGDTPKIEEKVISHVKSYYMTHSVEGVPSSAKPKQVDVVVDRTELVQGWTGRSRTSGTATIMSAGKYTQNYACEFEVMTEIDDKNVVSIIETNSKRKQ